jgi:hypothetical protein
MTATSDTARHDSVDVSRANRRPNVLMVVANPTTSRASADGPSARAGETW